LADVGKFINIVTKARYRIVGFTDSATVTLSGSPTAGSSLTWKLGGALLTLTTAFASPVLGGDRIWVGSGVYREVLTSTPFVTSELQINGDTDGSHTGDPGPVTLTAYTTNDKTTPNANALLVSLGRPNITWQRIQFIGGALGIMTSFSVPVAWIFRDCAFFVFTTAPLFGFTTSPALPSISFDRCFFLASQGSVFSLVAGTVAKDYDGGIVIRNSVLIAPTAAVFSIVSDSTTATGRPGNTIIHGCSMISGSGAIVLNNVSQRIATRITCCVIYSGGFAIVGATGALGSVLEDWNYINAVNVRQNCPIGAHTISNNTYSTPFHFGQEVIWGGQLRPFMEPAAISALLNFGTDGNETWYDAAFRPRSRRPNIAIGAYQRGGTDTQAIAPAPPTGTFVWEFTGPGFKDFQVPVDTTSTTISCVVQRDSAYVGAQPPMFQILENFEVGVPGQQVPDYAGSGVWNQLVAAPFTASKIGVITVRIWSQDASGSSVVAFANFTVT
jgi:hypothetical protein